MGSKPSITIIAFICRLVLACPNMALYQILYILVILASLTKGELTNKNWTTVYKFYPLDSGNNFVILEPKIPVTNSSGYSICLRVLIWKWDTTIVFDSPALTLVMFLYDSMKFCLFKNKISQLFCFTMSSNQAEWNAICFTHNFTDFLLNVSLNGKQMNSKKIQLDRAFLNELTKPLSIGLNTSFWGQISDFNIWNRPLSYEEVQQYSFGCHEGLSSQPEILDWSNASIISSGINSQSFKLNRQFLSCQEDITHFTLFENGMPLNYFKSLEFCNLLKGDLYDPSQNSLTLNLPSQN